MTVEDLLAKQAIHDALVTWCRGIDRLDAALVSSVYHPDAVDERPGFTLHGGEAGARTIPRLRDTTTATLHSISNELVTVRGDQADSECHFVARNLYTDGTMAESCGRYLDRFERRNGEWKIAHRRVILEWRRVFAKEELELETNRSTALRSREDASYTPLP